MGGLTLYWKTKVTTLLGIKYPIIQKGLSKFSYPMLASAVSNAGGLGQINAMNYPDELKLMEEIKRVREGTNKPFGVNFCLERSPRRLFEMIETVIDENVPVISIKGDRPRFILEKIKDEDIKSIISVSTVRQAKRAEEYGADFVLIDQQGQLKHLDRGENLDVMITQIVDQLSIPVIAETNVTDGRGLMAKLALGVEGIATEEKIIATKDCIQAHMYDKNKKIHENKQSTIVIQGAKLTPYKILQRESVDQAVKVRKREEEGFHTKEFISQEVFQHYLNREEHKHTYDFTNQEIVDIPGIPTVKDRIQTMMNGAQKIREKWNLKRLYDQ